MERAAEAIQDRAPAGEIEGLTQAIREYHVTFDGRHWNVETDEGVTRDAALDQDQALRLAIRAAQHDHAEGLDAMVCVEQQDGTSVLAWASA
jgi:hypothetical protein